MDDYPKPCIWLTFELHIRGRSLVWTLKNSNRQYLFGDRVAPFVGSFLPWPGALPYRFRQLRGILISKLTACWTARLDVTLTTITILEFVLELLRLGYPLQVSRALTHSLPKWPAAITARQAVREFQAVCAQLPPVTMGHGGNSRGEQKGVATIAAVAASSTRIGSGLTLLLIVGVTPRRRVAKTGVLGIIASGRPAPVHHLRLLRRRPCVSRKRPGPC